MSAPDARGRAAERAPEHADERAPERADERASAGSLFRAIWRVHFVAGLLSLPFLLLLAVTGGLYLFHDEIDGWVYRDLDHVAVRDGATFSMAALVDHAERQTGGRVVQFAVPGDAQRAVRMTVALPSGELRTAFMDPYNAQLRGTTNYGGVMQTVRKLHSLQLVGPRASWLIESAAGWVIVLVITGVYLWWPRGRRDGVVTVRPDIARRPFWRDLHAVVGVFASGIVLFLAVTGMPWSDIWGGAVQAWATQHGVSRPEAPATVLAEWQLASVGQGDTAVLSGDAGSDAHAHHGAASEAPPNSLPWAVEQAASPHSHAAAGREPLFLDDAIARFDALGLARPYGVMPPFGDDGAWVGTHAPADVRATRIVYLDRYDGHVLDDVGFARFGPAAKAIEWGIAVHQGEQYGTVNRYVMLAGCVAVVLLALSSVVMWWKRRPPRSLGMPPAPRDRRAQALVFALLIPVALVYPLVGATLAIAIPVSFAIGRWR